MLSVCPLASQNPTQPLFFFFYFLRRTRIYVQTNKAHRPYRHGSTTPIRINESLHYVIRHFCGALARMEIMEIYAMAITPPRTTKEISVFDSRYDQSPKYGICK